MDLSVKVSGMD